MKFQLTQNEKIIIKSPAELHNGINTITGIFYLTNERIIFEAHNINITNGLVAFPLTDILSLDKSWTKFLGIIPISYDSLSIRLKTGNIFSFVLLQRDSIYDQINNNRKYKTY
jgi:hypothetical protein